MQFLLAEIDAATGFLVLLGLAVGTLIGVALSRWFAGGQDTSAPQSPIGAILIDSETPELILRRFDAEGTLVFVSPGIRFLLGEEAAAFIDGRASFDSFSHPADRKVLQQAAGSRHSGDDRSLQYQYRVRRQDGRWHWLHERQEAIFDERGRVIAYETLAIDFSDRVRFEQQQQQMVHLQRLLSAVLEGVVETDDAMGDLGRILELVVEYLGLSSATILRISDGAESVTVAVAAEGDSTVPGPGVPGEGDAAGWWIRRITGGVPLTVSRKRLTEIEPRVRAAFAEALSGTAMVSPLLVEGILKFAFIIEAPQSDRTWEPEELSVLQAITHAVSRRLEQDESHKEREEFGAIRANIERSEAIAHFVSGIIHDFNNLMFAVSGRLALLLRRATDEATRSGLEEIRSAVGDAGGVLRRLLQAERWGMDDAILLDPWVEMAQIVRTAQRLLPKRIRFEADLRPQQAGGLQLIRAVPQTLQQLVLNLVVNSRDAVGMHGCIRISCRASDDGTSFEVAVEDDGPGIPIDQRSEVVKAFVSTKTGGHSTGLGLSICRRVIAEAGGEFMLDDSPLGGLKAMARLALTDGEVEDDENAPPWTTELNGCVLVIEDNATIREVLERELEAAGATVVAVPDAIDVESVIAARKTSIDLYLFDIDLPERTGVECLEDLRGAGDDTPCLFITGGTSVPPAMKNIDLLRKPFRTATLLEVCRELMER